MGKSWKPLPSSAKECYPTAISGRPVKIVADQLTLNSNSAHQRETIIPFPLLSISPS